MSVLKNNDLQLHKKNFHLIPGRLRVGIPDLLNNEKLAFQIAHRLAKFSGVKISYANPVTGQILVNFDPLKTDLKLLLSWISYIGSAGLEAQDPVFHSAETKSYSYASQKLELRTPVHKESMPWHLLDGQKAVALLESSVKTGLSDRNARLRLEHFGFNELRKGQRFSFWQMALNSLNGFMTKLLLVAAGVSLFVGETMDAAVIGAIVVVQAAVEAAQGYRAEKSLDNLKEFSAPLATVLREGRVQRISSKELVPGDILYLSVGDMVPADAIVIEAINLMTDEACLTGESIPVAKDNKGKNEPHIPVADQANMLFSGTSIIGGRATAMVVTTGMQTELGRIAQLLGNFQNEQTNLQKQLDYLGKKITYLVVISVGTIAIISLFRGRPFWEVLRSGISLAVGAVPEGLPAVLTVALSAGVQRMVKRNALVRNISAVETLGSTTVICTDKTGTLTKNEMTVKELYIDRTFYKITGDGYHPEGEILPQGDGKEKDLSPFVAETLTAAVLCNNARLAHDQKGKWTILGDPTEGALLTAAAKVDLWWQDLKKKHCRRREIAFDVKRRLMTVVCQESGGEYGVYVKGAPDAVVNYCSSVVGCPEPQALDLKMRHKILVANETMAQKALRVLAIAYKKLPKGIDLDRVDLESDLIFCGLAGMADTSREGVQEAIAKCHASGVRVAMITGDHQKTAEAVASELGILEQGRSITGEELEKISDEEFIGQVENIAVFSRTTPDQKLRIVRALKGRKQIVAMTGDGVNDAPAIKEADIGIAMGVAGTDVAREAADITLADDNFVTIVDGIEEGRTVNANLTKSIHYILSGSFVQLLTVFTSAALGLPTPLLPAQILWVNLVTESIPAMSFTADPPEQNCMNQPSSNLKEEVFLEQGRAILQKGLVFGLTTFGLYAAGLKWGGWSLTKARTMAFSQLVINRVFDLLNERKRNMGVTGVGRNPLILPAAALSASMLALTMYLPFMRPLFSTVPINFNDWILLAANAFAADKIDSLLESGNK
ncbi:MAG: cation-translocating P-type ATPase [Firmicutes bacterium]|nr:cation-translocating P-type ATPase [Bacillota bacterium]